MIHPAIDPLTQLRRLEAELAKQSKRHHPDEHRRLLLREALEEATRKRELEEHIAAVSLQWGAP